MATASTTATTKKAPPKALPAPNSEFYQLVVVLNAELAAVKKVRSCLEVAPVIDRYWADDAFPF
jgi:glutaryl-CoA dehydrogenase